MIPMEKKISKDGLEERYTIRCTEEEKTEIQILLLKLKKTKMTKGELIKKGLELLLEETQ